MAEATTPIATASNPHVAEDWVLVPRRATKAMLDAAYAAHDAYEAASEPKGWGGLGSVYSAMIASAPTPPDRVGKEVGRLANLAEIPPLGDKERERWLEQVKRQVFAVHKGFLCTTANGFLALMSEARKQGQRDVLASAPSPDPAGAGRDLDKRLQEAEARAEANLKSQRHWSGEASRAKEALHDARVEIESLEHQLDVAKQERDAAFDSAQKATNRETASVALSGGLEELAHRLREEVINREARRREILEWLQEDIGTAWNCTHCRYSTYHSMAFECANCGTEMPVLHKLAFKLHARNTDNEDLVSEVRAEFDYEGAFRSGKLVASTGSEEETKGEPSGAGYSSETTPSGRGPAGEYPSRNALHRLRWDYMPSYGVMDFRQLEEAISEVMVADRNYKIPSLQQDVFVGHKVVSINLNSLNRIVTAFAQAALALGTEAPSAETFGLGPKADGPACKATPQQSPSPTTETDPTMSVEEWRPIATAPKDGTLVAIRGTFRGGGGTWEGRGWFETAPADRCWYDAADDEPCRPTHWRPLAPSDAPSTTEADR